METLRRLVRPLVRLLCALRVSPNALTTLGWALATVAAGLFGAGYVKTAGALMLLGGLFDALDGEVARESNLASASGAFLDSMLDRLSEAAVFVGIIFLYASTGRPYETLLAGAAVSFSLMTSYTRARAEGLGYECKVGVLGRAGRVAILGVSAMFGFLTLGVGLVAAGALVTTVQRMVHVQRAARRQG